MVTPLTWFRKYSQERFTSVRLQVVCVSVTVTCVALLFGFNLSTFTSSNPYPDLTYITPQEQADLAGVAAIVNTGLFIRDFNTFDIIENMFVADAVIWFEFNPSMISLETIEQFSFERGTILRKSQPTTRVIGERVFAQYNIRVQFSTPLDHRLFPISDHNIFLILTNKAVSSRELMYKASVAGFSVGKSIYTLGWSGVNYSVGYGYSRSDLDKSDKQKYVSYPRVVFSIDFTKAGIRKMLLIVLPLFLMFFLSIFSLSLNPRYHIRPILTLSVGAITSLLAYRFVIERISPNVGYFTITDHLYTFILAASFVIFLFSVFSVRRTEMTVTFNMVRIGTIFILHISLVAFVYYLLFPWSGITLF